MSVEPIESYGGRTLSQEVHHQLDENSKAALNIQTFWDALRHEIQARLSGHGDLLLALQLRLESLDATVRQVAQSEEDLKRARRGRWGPLSVCERRLELQQQFQGTIDLSGLQQALEKERKVLLDSRASLQQRIHTTEAMSETLGKLRMALVEELAHCRRCRRVDHASLIDGGAAMLLTPTPERPERVQLPRLCDAPAQPDGSNAKSKLAAQFEIASFESATIELLHSVRDTEEHAICLCNGSDALVLTCCRDGAQVAARVQSCLAQYQQEHTSARGCLERQLRETDTLFDRLEKSLGRAKHRLQGQETALAPLRSLSPAAPSALSTTASSRQSAGMLTAAAAPRAARSSKSPKWQGEAPCIEDQVLTLVDGVDSLRNRVDHSEVLLRRLATSRWSLLDELRRRGGALRVIEACLKVSQVRVPVGRPSSHSSKRPAHTAVSARSIKALQQKAERRLAKDAKPKRPSSAGETPSEKPQPPFRLSSDEEFDSLAA